MIKTKATPTQFLVTKKIGLPKITRFCFVVNKINTFYSRKEKLSLLNTANYVFIMQYINENRIKK
jgi:hypothetical protein